MQSLSEGFVRVLPAAKIDKPLTYQFNAAIPAKSGLLVRVPLGNREVTGIVVDRVNTEWIKENEPDLNTTKIRLIEQTLDEKYALTPDLIDLIFWCSRYYHSPIGLVVSAFLPKSLLEGKPVTKSPPAAWECNINTDIINALTQKKQKSLLQWLIQNPQSSTQDILANGYGRHLITVLLKKEFIINSSLQVCNTAKKKLLNEPEHSLNEEQASALDLIRSKNQEHKPFLLNGVTGSGKTEIYLQKTRVELENQKQVLFLVPEIGLVEQTIKRIQNRFQIKILTYHSNSSEGEKIECWTQVKLGIPLIIVGTRSSIFLPFTNLGLIIIDEEHDLSYKQQEGFRYHARDVALVRISTKNHEVTKPKASLLLGSATPSIESLYNVERNLFLQLNINNRVGNRKLPNWQYFKPSTKNNPISNELIKAIHDELQQQNQVLIFINRRGYAPKLVCNNCGWQAICEACDSGMTLHNKPRQLICHRCDQRSTPPTQCPCCQSRSISISGSGTERIEHVMSTLFPETPCIRIDRDSTQRKGSFNSMLKSLEDNKAAILVGTQMLTKGHHLPGISLVAVLGADSALMSHDFRGIEHLSQSLTQVAGRAGRGISSGRVIIETSQPEHPVFALLAEQSENTNSYKKISHDIIQNRRLNQLPPYSFSAIAHINSPDFDVLVKYTDQCQPKLNQLIQTYEVEIIGPMPSPIEKSHGRFRYQIQFYSKSRSQLHSAISNLEHYASQLRGFSKIRQSIDIDPLSMD